MMKAMLLAAGRGERMLPLTRTLPKPVIPVLGRPMIEQILPRMASAGFTRVAVNLHHLPDAVAASLHDWDALGLEDLFLSPEETLLGTAGGVRAAADFLRGSGTFLVRNSDFLADIDLGAAARAHYVAGRPVTLVLAPARPGYTEVPVDREGSVLGFGASGELDPEKIAGRYLFTGVQFLEEEILDRIPPGAPSDLVLDVYRELAGAGAVASYVHPGYWWEFGTPRAYLQGSLQLLDMETEKLRSVATCDPIREIGGARVAMGAGADFLARVEFRGRVAVGLAGMVAEGSILEDSVVLAESWIGPDCAIRNCIVGPGVEIPSGTRLDDSLVCGDDGCGGPLPDDVERIGDLLVRPL